MENKENNQNLESSTSFDYDVFSLNEYDYPLDEGLIAQSPSQKRDESRLLVMNRFTGEYQDKHFYDIVNYFHKGDVLVRNDTKVIPARLFGIKKETNAKVEVLLLNENRDHKDIWECLCGNAKVIKVGTLITFGNNDELVAECLEVKDEGIRIFKMKYEGLFLEVLEKLGKMPLPPYIHNQDYDNSRYQTVYAEVAGSAAAPTAGFHFTDEIFEKLTKIGVTIVNVTLHVGLGTFRPVKESNILNHKMHSEYIHMTAETAEILNKAKEENRRIIAVGTTSTRTLEAIYSKYGTFKEVSEDTSIFIYPGYQFKAIDCLITNFHLPKSTLMMLVSAFSTRENILKAYQHALEEKYHFFSFGDAMFIFDDSKITK